MGSFHGVCPSFIQTNSQKQGKQSEDVLNCQYSMATFSTSERKNRPRGDRKSEEMAIHLKQSLSAAIMLELYEKSQIDVYVEILEASQNNNNDNRVLFLGHFGFTSNCLAFHEEK